MGRWEWYAWDKEAGYLGKGEWTRVQRDQIDHLVVHSPEHRCELPAVELAESKATIFDTNGVKITPGRSVKLPTGARKRQPQSGQQPQPRERVGVARHRLQ